MRAVCEANVIHTPTQATSKRPGARSPPPKPTGGLLYIIKKKIRHSAPAMPNMIYHNIKGLLKPIKPRPFIIQPNRPHKCTQGPSAPHTPRGGPCLTKKGGHGYRTFHQKAHFLEKTPFFFLLCARPRNPLRSPSADVRTILRACAWDFGLRARTFFW